MPGNTTNGLPLVGPALQNGVTLTAPLGQYPQVAPRAQIVVDTEATAGAAPQSVAATAFQVAALAALFQNAATSTVGAATLNTFGGLVTTEALTTAVGATYTFTLTNSLITTASAAPNVAIFSKSNTVAGMTLTSITVASGSVVFVFTNQGTAALNGTMLIAFSL